MPLISENYHEKLLKENNINIKTKYIVSNTILERNSDNSHNDDIDKGIRCQKEYFINNKLVHKENIFDSRIEYSYIFNKTSEEEYRCSNCGMISKVKDFVDRCPYCRTHYNIDYTDKELGNKYHYDLVLLNNSYRIVTAIIDLIISITLSYLFIKTTSRTFNNYDISKVFIYGIIMSLVLYYFFYILDAYVILSPIKKYKDKQNQKQIDFWNRTKIDKKLFFNNLNYEISKKYYLKEKLVDYDIIDYLSFEDYQKNNELYVKVKAYMRVIYYENKKLKTKYIEDTFNMKKNNKKLELKDGINYIKCKKCGSSIDATKRYCEYCKEEVNYLQDWIMDF